MNKEDDYERLKEEFQRRKVTEDISPPVKDKATNPPPPVTPDAGTNTPPPSPRRIDATVALQEQDGRWGK